MCCNPWCWVRSQINQLWAAIRTLQGGTSSSTVKVTQDTRTGYALKFDDDLETCRLMPSYEEYHLDLSEEKAQKIIYVGNVRYYIYNNGNDLRVTLTRDGSSAFTADVNTLGTNEYELSTSGLQYDDRPIIVGANHGSIVAGSKGRHSMMIRQQDPDTGLWSLCEVKVFASAGNSRVDVWVDWISHNVEYAKP